MKELEPVVRTKSAALLLHPLRQQILGLAGEPRSATEIARHLSLPRQKVHYHVRELAKGGFLRRSSRRRHGNLYEQRYVATSRTYVLAPQVLGPLGADAGRIRDRFSAAYLLALGARMHRELAVAQTEAEKQGKRLATLALDFDVRFANAAQRKEFTEALLRAVERVIATHTEPYHGGQGRPYSILVGGHPIPPESETRREENEDDQEA